MIMQFQFVHRTLTSIDFFVYIYLSEELRPIAYQITPFMKFVCAPIGFSDLCSWHTKPQAENDTRYSICNFIINCVPQLFRILLTYVSGIHKKLLNDTVPSKISPLPHKLGSSVKSSEIYLWLLITVFALLHPISGSHCYGPGRKKMQDTVKSF